MEKLSVAIITFNEEKNIGRCLDSVQNIADEIVVVDGFSSDKTQEICQSSGVKFFQEKWRGYVETKNLVTDKCTYNLVLSLDADEVLTEALMKKIYEVKLHRKADGYTMNRMTNYCGKWMKYGGWYPDKKLRLYDRTKGKWSGADVHEFFEIYQGGKIEHLDGDLLHYSFYSIEDHVKQASNFSKIAATSLYRRDKKTNILKVVFSGPMRFFRDYILKLGFLDGYLGLIRCLITGHATFLKQAYLYEARIKRKESKQ